jgi:biotin operon repressor
MGKHDKEEVAIRNYIATFQSYQTVSGDKVVSYLGIHVGIVDEKLHKLKREGLLIDLWDIPGHDDRWGIV